MSTIRHLLYVLLYKRFTQSKFREKTDKIQANIPLFNI